MNQWNGKVALLTGGSRGIGPVIAEAIAGRGASIILAARSESGLRRVAERVGKQGNRISYIAADLRIATEREKLVSDVLKQFGKIDVLINNAGLENEGSYTELAWSAIKETIEVNLLAPMHLTHLVLPEMISRKNGHIVNVASLVAKSGVPYDAVYSGTKAGLAEWTHSLRLELAGTGINFSTIFPGYVRDVGMFAKFSMKSPWIIGSCAPSQVAAAVIKVIDKQKPEQIVNSRPVRYAFLINELSPTIGDWLMRISGAVAFQRKKVGK